MSPLPLTRSRKNHIGDLCGHLREIRGFNDAPLPVLIPLDKIPENDLYCRLPNEGVVALGEAWPCDSPVLSPLIVLTHENIWTVSNLLNDFNDASDLWKSCATLKDRLNEILEPNYYYVEILVLP